MSSKPGIRLGPSSWSWHQVPQVDTVEEKYEDSLEDSSRTSNDDSVEALLPYRHESPKTRRLLCVTLINLLILAISTTFFSLAIFYHRDERFNAAAKASSSYCQ